MDPFSITVGAIGVLDVCFRLARYLNDVKEGSDRIDEDIDALYQQVAAIGVVVQSVQNVFNDDRAQTGVSNADNLQGLWQEVSNNIKSCRAALDKLFILISHIVGRESSKQQSKLEGFRRYLRKNSKEEEFNRIRLQLTGYHYALQTLLTSVNIVLTKRVQSTSDRSFTQISTDIAELRKSLREQIALLQASADLTHSNTLVLATEVLPDASANEHFFAKSVDSMFTGRKRELENLRKWMLAPMDLDGPRIQKRFVVYGLGGSGKSQFCNKFAQDNRQSFWGVFWVDATSDENAKHSFRAIANIAEKNPPTEIAAKNWLSNTRSPWLLIIDNADKLEKSIDSYFPQGERGCILITTRNFELAQQGTCGDRYYHFSSLEENEANELFLRAAEKPSPWTMLINQLAAAITKKLGFLPLALVQAGRTILGGVRIEDFLSSYEKHWDRLRHARTRSKKKPKADSYTVIYSTYETLYQGLEERRSFDLVAEDAIYILKLFSFLYRENIRMDILTQAVNNPYLQKCSDEMQKEEAKSTKRPTRPKSWSETARDMLIEFIGLVRRGERPVLPDLLAWNEFPELFDDSRLRAALKELQKMALVTHDREKDSYSMHPVVHSWVRKRSEMTLSEQAIFCHATATVLSNAILLPPLGLREEDEDFRRELMPHVDHVRRCQKRIREQNLREQVKRRWKGFSILQPQLDRLQCLQLAKFSYVYVQSGRFKEASELQYEVFEFLHETFGMEHESTLRVAPLLAGVVRHLDRVNEAAELQEKVLNACIALWGEEDPQALEAASALGVTRWQQGEFTEARNLHQRALYGYTSIRGPGHPDTLNAMSRLAAVHTKTLAFPEAINLLDQAVAGLRKERGEGHEDTMVATKELGMTYLERVIHRQGKPDDLNQAYQIMQEVVLQRQEKSGKEHGLTLWAIADLARVKSARGGHGEAEADFRAGLPIVEDNFGKDHIGTLYGKTYFSHVLICAKKYDEAEQILVSVIDSHQRSRPNHPDQLVGLSFLLKLYNVTGRQTDAANVRDRIQAGLDALGIRGQTWRGHSWERQLFDAWVPQDEVQVSSPTTLGQDDEKLPAYESA